MISTLRIVAILTTALLLAGCTSVAITTPTSERPIPSSTTPEPSLTPSASPTLSPTPTPSPTKKPKPTPTPSPTETVFIPEARPVITPIGKKQWERIVATGTWREGCPAGRDNLRRLDINFYDFEGDVERGSLVANLDVIDDLAAIFTELFNAEFPLESLQPVENFDGDVIDSLEANNTSAFNCRRPDQINAPVPDSPHANGRAIDINPYQNPWTDPRCRCWVPSDDYSKVRIGPGVIVEDGLPWQLFTSRGWIWQDIKVPDYMHFDTGFPSRPRTPAIPSAG